MMERGYLFDLLDHQAWGDSEIWRVLLHSSEALSDSRIVGWLHHIHYVQHAFLRVWLAKPIEDLPEQSDFTALADLSAWGLAAHEALRSYLQAAGDADLSGHFEPPWADQFGLTASCREGEPTVEQSLIQASMHTAHHRGQISARLRALGATPPSVDFIVWLWSGRPKAQWTVKPLEGGRRSTEAR